MCGIAGFSGPFPPELIQRMMGILAHRGPDGQGTWIDEKSRVALGHARLSIIDLSIEGKQPMANEDKTLWLTFNGEIYNYMDIKPGLEARGHRFHSKTDSEILLHLFEEEGPAMLSRLNGIFAFAIWNSKTRELFIARDALGVKPLYYSENGTGFIFSSELKAIMLSPAVGRDLDFAAMHEYMTFMWSTAPTTMLKNVRKLPPGHFLRVREGKIVEENTWYTLPYDDTRFTESEERISSNLAESVRVAVERQLMSDVPVGAFLSGGLDSSAIVAMMRKNLNHGEIPCYSIGFENAGEIEGCPLDLPYAKKVAQHLDVKLHEIIVTPEQLITRLPELIYFMDEPQSDPAPLNAMFIAERARADGIKVLLSGAGGDDIFSGYRRHLAISYDPYLDLVPKAFRKVAKKLSNRFGDERNPLIRRGKKLMSNIDLEPAERLISYFKWSPDEVRSSLLNEDIRRELSHIKVEGSLLASLKEIPLEHDPLNRMLFLDCKHFLTDHNLNYSDKTSMRHGVEARVPLLDIDLVKFATRIPPGMKQKGKIGKAIFKKSMEPYLPREIIYREKTGFGAPLRKWIMEDLHEMIIDLLSPASIKSRGLFDSKGVTSIIEANRKGRVDGAYTIFSLLCIELWCQIFLDNKPWQGMIKHGEPPEIGRAQKS